MTRVIILNGPSGAGKSTTAKALLEAVDGTWAYIGQDDVRSLVLKGYRSANGMSDTWDDEIKNQMAVSIPLCADMVKRYVEFGVNWVLDIYADGEDFRKWQHELRGITYTFVVLLPDLQTTIARNQKRTGTARLTDEKITYNHTAFTHSTWPSDAVVIDSTNLSVEDVVKLLK